MLKALAAALGISSLMERVRSKKERCWLLFVGGRKGKTPALACLLLLLSSSSQVYEFMAINYEFMDINYPCSLALAEASLTWSLVPN